MNVIYTYRKSILEKMQYFELKDTYILFRQEGRNDLQIPYKRVDNIRLFFLANNRYRPNSYGCKISFEQTSFDIHSYNYEGFADFKEQNKEYVYFVKELVYKVKAVNPICILQTGQTSASYYGKITIIVISILLLIFTLTITSGSILPNTLFFIFIKFLMFGYLGIYVLKSIKINKPEEIRGNEIPDYILPEIIENKFPKN